MNPPVPNRYDPENARRLAQYSADAYLPGLTDLSRRAVESAATDTRAVVTSLAGDLVVAFRGTADWRNWLTDVDWRKAPLGWSAGKVHRGFNLALESVAATLDRIMDPEDSRRLWVTGHSLGGALAMLLALRCKARRRMNVAGVYTFGQPRVGNFSFSLLYDDLLKARTYRVVHADDLVPRLPWVLGTYRHAGHEAFYEWAPGLGHSAVNRRMDRPFWTRIPTDIRGLTRNELAPLADHHVSRYVELLNAECPKPEPAVAYSLS